MATAAELRQILKEDASGKNLYDHLTETLMKILIERPKNAYDSFELISADVKANPLNPDPEIGKPLPLSVAEMEKKLNWIRRCSVLLKVPEEPPEEPEVRFPDLLDDAQLYEWAGYNFGKGELYRLYLSVKKLSETLTGSCKRLRFFGKIMTRGLPYFVLEGDLQEDEEGIDEMKQEGLTGANRLGYWVTQTLEGGSSTWTRLPNVTMAQIVQVRQFRRFLTGNLDAPTPVPSYPPFDGTEKNLLRAMIACIAGSTSISPDGFFDLSEDEPPQVVPAEGEALAERFPKSAAELRDPENWKHHEPELNRIGRVTALPEQLDENGEPIEPADGEEPAEPATPLDAIKPEQWTFRTCPGGAGAVAGDSKSASAVVARSLLWPGAVAVATPTKFVNLYVGYGLPYAAKAYSPPLPAPISVEWAPPADEAEEGGAAAGGMLMEQADPRVDPTPPAPEGEEEEE